MSDEGKLVVEEGQEVVRRTVVGGRAPQAGSRKRSVSVGVEKILVLANQDAAFRRALAEDREGALAARGLHLSPTELAVLRNLSTERLLAMAGGIDLARHGKRRFLQSVAAVALAATTATASLGCDETTFNAAGGARPDWMGEPTDAAVIVDTSERRDVTAGVDIRVPGHDVFADLGITPDLAGEDVEPPEDAPQVGGIRPDWPDGEEW